LFVDLNVLPGHSKSGPHLYYGITFTPAHLSIIKVLPVVITVGSPCAGLDACALFFLCSGTKSSLVRYLFPCKIKLVGGYVRLMSDFVELTYIFIEFIQELCRRNILSRFMCGCRRGFGLKLD
jgi:hypothetical protein